MATITTGLDKLITPTAVRAVDGLGFYARRGKRLFDIAASIAALAITSPLLVVCAVMVRLTSHGPVLFRQTRVGHLGRPFTLVKFRTMVQGAEALGASVVIARDPRLTPVGSFLRRTKLDELPQFMNVLRGEMSFVGPRPRVPREVDGDDPREQLLLSVRPGVTSYATIHHRMEADYCARHANPQAVYYSSLLPQKRYLDSEYLQNPTFRMDLKLLMLTLVLVCIPGKSLARGLTAFGEEARPYTRGAQMLLDLVVYAGAAWLAYTIRYEAGFLDFYRRQMWLYIAFIPPVRVVANRCLGIYDMMWRYVTLEDAALLVGSLAPVTLILFAFRLELPTTSWKTVLLIVPFSITALECLLALSASLALRIARRRLYMLHHHYQPLPEEARRVLILGAGLLGLMTAQDIRQYPHMSIVGFLDDDPAKNNRLMAGCRILGSSAKLEDLCSRHKVTDLLVCAKSIGSRRSQELNRRCEALGVAVHVLPGLDQVLRNESDLPIPETATQCFVGERG